MTEIVRDKRLHRSKRKDRARNQPIVSFGSKTVNTCLAFLPTRPLTGIADVQTEKGRERDIGRTTSRETDISTIRETVKSHQRDREKTNHRDKQIDNHKDRKIEERNRMTT